MAGKFSLIEHIIPFVIDVIYVCPLKVGWNSMANITKNLQSVPKWKVKLQVLLESASPQPIPNEPEEFFNLTQHALS